MERGRPKDQLAEWERILSRPDWYLAPEIEGLRDRQGVELLRFYDLLERRLVDGTVAVGRDGTEWDAERKPIDRVVVHHTSRRPGISTDTLSALGLFRLYAHFYANPTPRFSAIRGRPLYSGHVRNGRQVFYAYHWIVRRGGVAERLLEDHEIGWHARDWETNCRSVGLVFDNDYERGRPGRTEIEAAATIVRERYPSVGPAGVVGHREVRPGRTTCPGDAFSGPDGWKRELGAAIRE